MTTQRYRVALPKSPSSISLGGSPSRSRSTIFSRSSTSTYARAGGRQFSKRLNRTSAAVSDTLRPSTLATSMSSAKLRATDLLFECLGRTAYVIRPRPFIPAFLPSSNSVRSLCSQSLTSSEPNALNGPVTDFTGSNNSPIQPFFFGFLSLNMRDKKPALPASLNGEATDISVKSVQGDPSEASSLCLDNPRPFDCAAY